MENSYLSVRLSLSLSFPLFQVIIVLVYLLHLAIDCIQLIQAQQFV